MPNGTGIVIQIEVTRALTDPLGRFIIHAADSVVEGARVRVIWLEEGALGAAPTWREVITDAAGSTVCVYRRTCPYPLRSRQLVSGQ